MEQPYLALRWAGCLSPGQRTTAVHRGSLRSGRQSCGSGQNQNNSSCSRAVLTQQSLGQHSKQNFGSARARCGMFLWPSSSNKALSYQGYQLQAGPSYALAILNVLPTELMAKDVALTSSMPIHIITQSPLLTCPNAFSCLLLLNGSSA